jgi:hypothetical protein
VPFTGPISDTTTGKTEALGPTHNSRRREQARGRQHHENSCRTGHFSLACRVECRRNRSLDHRRFRVALRGATVVQVMEVAIRVLEPSDTARTALLHHMHMPFEHDTGKLVVLERHALGIERLNHVVEVLA